MTIQREANSEFLLLIGFDDVRAATMLDRHAQRIHDEYMERFGDTGALTVFILALEGDYDIAIRYEGPEESRRWLEDAIATAAKDEGGSARLTTPVVVGDITDRF